MFEKYDGLRGFWNPQTKAFYSRKGNRFIFPPEIIEAMSSDVFLDGELWLLPSSLPPTHPQAHIFILQVWERLLSRGHEDST